MGLFQTYKITTALCLIFLSSGLFSQVSMNVTSYLVRDDNAYKNRDAFQTLMNHSALQLGYGWNQNAFRLRGYYTVDANQYSENNVFNSISQQIIVKSSFDMNENVFQINGLFKTRQYDEELNYYNIDRYQLNAQIQNSPSLERIGTAGIQVQKDRYTQFDDLDNLTYQFYGQYQYFFQSGLSLTGNLNLGVKEYLNQSVVYDFGSGVNPLMMNRSVEEAVKASQLRASLKVGKSLTSKTGLSLTAGGQWFIGAPIASYTGGVYYYTENDLYDDPYAYQGEFADIQLTRQFNVGFQVKLGTSIQKKDYAGTPALDDNGDLLGETRQDSRNEYYLTVNKKIMTGWRVPNQIQLFANFIYRQNPSNDPYYDFEDQIGMIGFSLGF